MSYYYTALNIPSLCSRRVKTRYSFKAFSAQNDGHIGFLAQLVPRVQSKMASAFKIMRLNGVLMQNN